MGGAFIERKVGEAIDEPGRNEDRKRLLFRETLEMGIGIEIACDQHAIDAASIGKNDFLGKVHQLGCGKFALLRVLGPYLWLGGAIVAFEVHAVAGDNPILAGIHYGIGVTTRGIYAFMMFPVGP